jgi:hypothetical protein
MVPGLIAFLSLQMTEQRKQKQRLGLLNSAASYQFGNQFM